MNRMGMMLLSTDCQELTCMSEMPTSTQRFFFTKIDFQCIDVLSHNYDHLLFVFKIFSIALSAMEVQIAIKLLLIIQWQSFWSVCRWLILVNLSRVVSSVLMFLPVLLVKIMNEWIFAIRVRIQIIEKPEDGNQNSVKG